MPVVNNNRNLFRTGRRQFRNPICLAKEWRMLLDSGRCSSATDLSRYLQVSRARVTQVMNLLLLSSEVIEIILELGDPLKSPIVTERKLRPLILLSPEQQYTHVEYMLSKY